MNQHRIAAAVAAVTTTAALVTLGTATTAAADDRTVTSYADQFYGTPKSGTGGLIFRTSRGADTGSGMGETDRFAWTGSCAVAAGVELIEVRQITRGQGGWGSAYTGYVRRAYANVPPSLPC